MTDTESIEAVKLGKRAITNTTLSNFKTKEPNCFNHNFRTVACDSETDVVECYNCGYQRLARCDFNEEYA